VRRHIGLTGQYAAVDPFLTGRENLHMVGRLLGMSRRDAGARAARLLESFELTDAADRALSTYSGGMQRRLDLALSLTGSPAIVFLDEPTTGLDPRSRFAMWQVVEDLVAGGTTVLLSTQYLDERTGWPSGSSSSTRAGSWRMGRRQPALPDRRGRRRGHPAGRRRRPGRAGGAACRGHRAGGRAARGRAVADRGA